MRCPIDQNAIGRRPGLVTIVVDPVEPPIKRPDHPVLADRMEPPFPRMKEFLDHRNY